MAKLLEVENLAMTREKTACMPESILMVSFSPAVCVEHTADVLPAQVPS